MFNAQCLLLWYNLPAADVSVCGYGLRTVQKERLGKGDAAQCAAPRIGIAAAIDEVACIGPAECQRAAVREGIV